MTQPIAPEFVLLQQAVIGRYSLERELGRGGMGIVFLARDVALDRPVAIKLLPPALAARPDLRDRFLREARTAARLSHPNIVAIHAVEEAGELVFFVMTYLDGQTVGELLRARGALTPSEAARMIQEVAWALGYAHGRGLVHRDVKPDNIMIERASGRAIVMDFGIAGAAGGAAEAFGTAQYVSPEQARGESVDGRSDLYSLGVVSFLALTGRLPFDAPDTQGVLAMHITRPAPTLLSMAPGMPRKLAQAIDRCLAKDPAERFADGEALAESVGASVEPPRQLPVPVRLWLNKAEQDRQAWLLLWFGMLGGPTSMLMATIAATVFGWTSTLPYLIAVKWYALVPIFAGSASRIWQLRKLLAQGYSVEDAKLAVKDLVQRRREEVSFEYGKEPPLWAKLDRVLMIASGTAFFGFGLNAVFFSSGLVTAIGMAGSAAVWLGTALLQTVRPGKRLTGDTYAEWRLKFWNSRLGKLFEKIARFGLKPRAVPAELTHRPTELAIGIAADSLFGSLPKEQRKELKELPSVLERLQHDAAAMRETVDQLSQALAMLGDAGRPDTERDRLRAELTAQRDAAAARMAAAVSALESLRLNLLRLKAGMGSVGELTADLSAARTLADTMRYATEGNAEVARLLNRQRTPTPPGPLVPSHG